MRAGAVGARTQSNLTGFGGNSYTLTLGLSVPIFSGFSHLYDVRAAREQVAAAQARAELTRQMVAIAETIDFSVDSSGFDSERFERFLERLPGEIVPESRRWTVWFLGGQEKTERFRVERGFVTIPETLACAHAYAKGDILEVTPEQRAKILSTPHMASEQPIVRVQEEAKSSAVEPPEAVNNSGLGVGEPVTAK